MMTETRNQLQAPHDPMAFVGKFFWIKVGASSAPGGYEMRLEWRMLTGEIFQKWRWYFDYRAARYKVEHPREYVEITYGQESMELVDPLRYEQAMLARKIISCKGKITEWLRKMDEAERNYIAWMERDHQEQLQRSPLFAPAAAPDPQAALQQEPNYQRAVAKVAAKRRELAAMQIRYNELINTPKNEQTADPGNVHPAADQQPGAVD